MNGVVVSIVFFSVDPQVKLCRPKDMYDEKVCAANQGPVCAVGRMKGVPRIMCQHKMFLFLADL